MKVIGLFFYHLYNIAFRFRLQHLMRVYAKSINEGKGGKYFIGSEVNISFPENVYIGDGTYINGAEIVAKNAKIIIGNNCLLSYKIHMRTDSHNYLDKDKLIKEQGNFSKDIVIEDDCWIGYGVQVLPGVTIAEGCVIGAGAVVTKNTERYGVYVGIPARRIKERFSMNDGGNRHEL